MQYRGRYNGVEVENQSSIFVPKLTFFRYNLDSLTINTPAAVKKTRVAFHTLGCKLNFSETASIARDFSEEHYTRVTFEEAADVYVINTCSVTENADKRFKALVAQAVVQPLRMMKASWPMVRLQARAVACGTTRCQRRSSQVTGDSSPMKTTIQRMPILRSYRTGSTTSGPLKVRITSLRLRLFFSRV